MTKNKILAILLTIILLSSISTLNVNAEIIEITDEIIDLNGLNSNYTDEYKEYLRAVQSGEWNDSYGYIPEPYEHIYPEK
ncbi:MAG: hypothetical protein PUC88_01665 [Clostridia bacterium]|nr:hypothetical protein [Clostridia bacterium]